MGPKKILLVTLLLTLLLLPSGCAPSKKEAARIQFDGERVTTTDDTVRVQGSIATITYPGTYYLSGKTGEGQLIVQVERGGAVRLVLDGLDLSSSKDSPIIIREATAVELRIAEQTTNVITDTHSYSEYLQGDDAAAQLEEKLPDGAIYSRAPLLFMGGSTGKLVINGKSHNGISCSKHVTIHGGNLTVTAVHHGIRGKDFVSLQDGTVSITSGNDGIKATNTEEAAFGYLTISGGSLIINAKDDGLYAPKSVTITDGLITINSKNLGVKTEGIFSLSGGITEINTDDDPYVADSTAFSKAGVLLINGSQE